MRWEDVQLDGGRHELIVRHSHKGPTKSGKVRRVPLFEPARLALKAWKDVCPKNKDGLVFPTVRGERRPRRDDAGWSDQSIPVRDRKVGGPTHKPGWKTLAGITRRVRFHDLRHTCASHLAMGTWGRVWSLSEIRDFLGHSSIVVTQRYAHLSPEHLHRAASETCVTTAATIPAEAASTPIVVSTGVSSTPVEAPAETPSADPFGSRLGHTVGGDPHETPIFLARLGRVELPTPRSVVWCSIH